MRTMNWGGKALPAILFFLILGVIVVIASYIWLRQPVSNQELLANFAKAQDFLAAAGSVGGLPWWSPMFLQGTSLAPAWSFMVTNVVIWAFSLPLGFLAGPKVAMLAVMVAGSGGVWLFLRSYSGDRWAAVVGAFLFLLSPSVLTRAAGYEHFVVVCSMALLPWTFLALLVFFRSPCLRTSLLPAMAYGALMLAHGKTGLMALPVLLIFSGGRRGRGCGPACWSRRGLHLCFWPLCPTCQR